MTDYRVLLVAPPSDLPMAEDEVQQVVNTLRAKVVRGSQADVQGFLNMLVEPFDIVWFAAHGDHQGIYLNDGLLSTSEITTGVRSVDAKLVVLNTCSSRGVAREIYEELQIDLVCTVTKVPDRMAYFTGTVFARMLANGLPFRQAYEQAKPGQNATYYYFPEKEKLAMPPPPPDPVPALPRDADFYTLQEQVRQLRLAMIGNPDYNVKGLAKLVDDLNDKVDAMALEFVTIRSNQIFNRRVLIFLAIICFALLIAESIDMLQNLEGSAL